MYWKIKHRFLKIIWIQLLLLNFKYKLFREIWYSKIQVIKEIYIQYRYLLFIFVIEFCMYLFFGYN